MKKNYHWLKIANIKCLPTINQQNRTKVLCKMIKINFIKYRYMYIVYTPNI